MYIKSNGSPFTFLHKIDSPLLKTPQDCKAFAFILFVSVGVGALLLVLSSVL